MHLCMRIAHVLRLQPNRECLGYHFLFSRARCAEDTLLHFRRASIDPQCLTRSRRMYGDNMLR